MDEPETVVVLDLDDPIHDGQTLPEVTEPYQHVHSTTGICVKHPNGQFCPPAPAVPVGVQPEAHVVCAVMPAHVRCCCGALFTFDGFTSHVVAALREDLARMTGEDIGYILANFDRLLEVHRLVVMDTEEDRELHDRACDTFDSAMKPMRDKYLPSRS